MKFAKLIFIGFVLFLAACITNQPIKSDDLVMPDPGQIGIYYFRTSVRCETCNAIEQLIIDELEGKYFDELESGKIVFRQFNLDDPAVATFALQFEVVFKSLYILADNEQINLTSEAFLYAVSKPNKFKKLFEKSIDQY